MSEVTTVKFKRLHPDAMLPVKATAGAAAFDLVAVENTLIRPGETTKVRLGFAVELPPNYVMLIVPRSGVSLRTKLRQPNSVGVIDSDYRGEVAMMFDNIAHNPFEETEPYVALTDGEYRRSGTYLVRKGDRIAQAMIQRLPDAEFVDVDDLSDTARGDGGFGSTGVSVE